jgi:hypothetical protein
MQRSSFFLYRVKIMIRITSSNLARFNVLQTLFYITMNSKCERKVDERWMNVEDVNVCLPCFHTRHLFMRAKTMIENLPRHWWGQCYLQTFIDFGEKILFDICSKIFSSHHQMSSILKNFHNILFKNFASFEGATKVMRNFLTFYQIDLHSQSHHSPLGWFYLS